MLSIGEMAKTTTTKVVTIRYYEKIGLLPAPERTAGNYRAYSALHQDRLRFIRRCRDLGFSLQQVSELLDLSVQSQEDCAAVDQIADGHLVAIEQKISDLQGLAKELRKINNCCKGGRISDCRIIEAFTP